MTKNYFSTDEIEIDLENSELVSQKYNQGYVITRLAKGKLQQTRSLRINLEDFKLTSENRRILRKTENVSSTFKKLPLEDYSWEIHKMGKDFYSTKFGEGTMSASKIKELFTEREKSNVNSVFEYKIDGETVGYCLCYENKEIIHYSYPFYNLELEKENMGMGMMIRAVEWAMENGKKYIYLGSVVSPESKYKLQFNNLEWWDGENWNSDLEKLKGLL